MRSDSLTVSSRRSLSAPCASIRHLGSLILTLSDESGDNSSNAATASEALGLSAEMVEAAAALANPRLHTVTRAAALFPNFSARDACMTHDEENVSAKQHLANSQECRMQDGKSEPVLFDRLNAASSQINLQNRVIGHTVERCAKLEEINKDLNERLESSYRDREVLEQLVAELKKQLAAYQQGSRGSHNS
ncbi:hypothetical protein LSM04_003251 [Trypanosoma melophagium]|uniref:uncharacterized protein n=1 Tax=Trypanosoma melophagium TaxID=715481 RepID=UPI00351A0E09|nr:hypothetical protein LSM04_003251 [Trypanosoma melophagium]